MANPESPEPVKPQQSQETLRLLALQAKGARMDREAEAARARLRRAPSRTSKALGLAAAAASLSAIGFGIWHVATAPDSPKSGCSEAEAHLSTYPAVLLAHQAATEVTDGRKTLAQTFPRAPFSKEFDNRGATPVVHIAIGFHAGETPEQEQADMTTAQQVGETIASTYGVAENQITLVSVENGAGTDPADFRLQIGRLVCPKR